MSESNGTASGRGPDGKFTVGNKYGKGRPPRPTEVAYLATLADAVSLADWKAITQKAVSDAMAGDATARAWLSKYVLGESPPSITEVTAGELADGPFWDLAKAVANRHTNVDYARRMDRHDHHWHAEELVEAATGMMEPDDLDGSETFEALKDLLLWHAEPEAIERPTMPANRGRQAVATEPLTTGETYDRDS